MLKINNGYRWLTWVFGTVFAAGVLWGGYNALGIKVAKLESKVSDHDITIAKIEPTLLFLVDTIKEIKADVKELRRR